MDKYCCITLLSLMVALYLPSLVQGECEGSGISSDTDEITIKFAKTLKEGKKLDDITEVEITWTPNLDLWKVGELNKYDIAKHTLYYRTDIEWEAFVPTKKNQYTDSYTWTVPRVPCVKYQYQIVVPAKTESGLTNCFDTNIKSLEPSSNETIRNAEYQPQFQNPCFDSRIGPFETMKPQDDTTKTTTISFNLDKTEIEPGISSTPVQHTYINRTTDSFYIDVNTTGLTIAVPIAVSVVIVICIIVAIALFWYIRHRKGVDTNIEEATKQKRYSQLPVNEIRGYDGNQ